MRGTLLAMIVAAGIGLVGTAGVSAAPISGAGLSTIAGETNAVDLVHWRGPSGWRRGWRGRGGFCRTRCNPWRCWRVCY